MSIESKGYIGDKDRVMKAYHARCPVAVQAIRDADGVSQVIDLKMFLLIQENEEVDSDDPEVPRSLSTKTTPISRFVIDHVTAKPGFSASFGVSVPFRKFNIPSLADAKADYHSPLGVSPIVLCHPVLRLPTQHGN
jgi:hypothetical protein